MKVRVVCNFKTFKHENVQRVEIQPKRVRLETAEGQVTELPFDYAYGLAAVVVFEEIVRRACGPHE